MLGKSWKKILLVVLIVACLFNIVSKLVKRNSFKQELIATYNYFVEILVH
jgi:hypothetical protein